MPIDVTPLQENFGAEVTGVDFTKPVDGESMARIEAIFTRYAVLVFPDQPINDEQQIALTRQFGPLESNPGYAGGKMFRREEVADFTNVADDDSLMRAEDPRRNFNIANQLWHTDSSFKHIPAKCSLLSAREISPAGGQTEFADLRSAYEALPENRKQELEGLVAEHSIFHSRSQIGFGAFNKEIHQQFPPVNQMIVRRHPGSGKKTLYLAAHASHVVGWPIEQGRGLIRELIDFATQPQFVYRHRWRVADLVLWDNRCTMHRGRPYDDSRYRRVMHNTKAADIANTVDQENALQNLHSI
ncbi:MAG TPA: TauD/TfdA family dioxygenase [Candidatus Polarisedimenticolia bacterium]|nr:TauD/TfdA family dioxygenase [Candidatus Polarisedimenticolia bacterium]